MRYRASIPAFRRQAFTVIELLVVIAIISILAAILFPVFAQVRDKGRSTACLSNLRQIGQAVVMYSNDYDETLVPGTTGKPFDFTFPYFDTLLDPYIKNERSSGSVTVWTCPTAGTNPAGYTKSIGMNRAVAVLFQSNSSATPITLAQIQYPAELIVMNEVNPNPAGGDASFGTGSFGSAYRACYAVKDVAAATLINVDKPYIRHQGGANYAFADGHAKWYRPERTLVPNVLWYLTRPAESGVPTGNCNNVPTQ